MILMGFIITNSKAGDNRLIFKNQLIFSRYYLLNLMKYYLKVKIYYLDGTKYYLEEDALSSEVTRFRKKIIYIINLHERHIFVYV